MKTQISRHSFAPERRYSGVYQQMGRMITDADWNELNDLVRQRLVDALNDVIGDGTPRGRGLVRQTGDDSYELRWGQVYVDGIPARVLPDDPTLPPPFRFERQADLPGVPTLATGSYRLYLDVWERSVTQLEDPALLDPGLHGADTCTRTQTMAQVKACPPALDPADATLNPPLGTIPLSLWIRQGATLHDPCDPCAEELALPEDVGNFLFRIEVHDVSWSDDAVPVVTGLTLKWSRENGAEAYRVDQGPPGFASDQWSYEFFSGPSGVPADDMRSEKHLGRHLLPGFSPTRGVLTHGYDPDAAAGMTLVRRWDGFGRFEIDSGNWTLVDGFDRNIALSTGYSDTDQGYVAIDSDARVTINLDQMLLQFGLKDALALAGDYWQAPVRQAIHSAGDLLLDTVLPQGIRHHYWRLGTVEVDGDGAITAFTPDIDGACRAFEFPPLTDIDAADVCYSNDACDMPGVRTVEDALDHLCRERDLRWHNKHLHGWGVVCGLVAECGGEVLPDPDGNLHRRRVRVTRGYALDCDGNDIVLDEQQFFDVIAALETLDNNGLDDNGDGQVCLYIERDDTGAPALRISADEPADDSQYGWLNGTIWFDFYNDCLKGLLDEIRAEVESLGDASIAAAETDQQLISPQRMRLVTLLNLVAQLFYRPHGETVFLSPKEHELLRAFYLRLREILASKTFCAQTKGQEFPDYPFPDTGIDTWFGKNQHDHVLRQPSGELLLSYGGAGTELNLYAIAGRKLATVSQVPSAEGAEITAAAFSNDSQLLFVAANINGTDSILSRARVDGSDLAWETSAVLCGLQIADLRFDSRQDQILYALSVGDGLFVLNVEQLFGDEKQIPTPACAFNASGHIVYDPTREIAWATAQSADAGDNDGHYDRLVQLDLAKVRSATGAPLEPVFVLPLQQDGQSRRGSDGVALNAVSVSADGANSLSELYVAIDGDGSKAIWQYGGELGPDAVPQRRLEGLADTQLRLHYHPLEQGLLVSLEDEFRLQLWQRGKAVVERIPVQLFPCDFCIDPKSGDVLVLNFASNTISAYPRAELHVDESFLSQLRSYRLQVLLAFVALFGNLLQNLKDCFCHLLLTRCPECSDEDRVWLAKVEIRANEVYKICNFAKRRHVKTFPKVDYWLSLVPIMPLIRKAVQKFCCSVIPNQFSALIDRYQTPVEGTQTPIKGARYRQAVKAYQRTDTTQLLRAQRQNLSFSGALAADGLMAQSQVLKPGGSVSKQAYRNLPTDEAVQKLQASQIQTEVKPYDPQRAGDYIRTYTTTPDRIPTGSKVTVYEDQGKVKFYSLEPQAGTLGPALDDSQLAALEKRKAALAQTGDIQNELSALENRKTTLADVSALEKTLSIEETRKAAIIQTDDLQKQLTALDQQKTSAQQDIEALQIELKQLQTQRDQMSTELASLNDSLKSTAAQFEDLRIAIDGQRPLGAAGIDASTAGALREQGVLTLSDLAAADTKTLTTGTNLTKTQASKLIRDTRTRLKLG